jgi:hypothetical protein
VQARELVDGLGRAPFNLGQATRVRQELGALLDQSQRGSSEFRLITRMRSALDQATDDATQQGIITGDPQRIGWLRDARARTREMEEFWRPDSQGAQSFMQRLRDGQIQGQQVYDALWSTGQLDSGSASRDIIDHLVTQVGTNSPLFRDVQQSAMRNILLGRTGNAYEMGPQRFLDRVNRAMAGRGEAIWRQLGLPVDDINDLAYLERALQASQSPNKSNTLTSAIANRVGRISQKYPAVGMMYNQAAAQRQAAERAIGLGQPEGATLHPGMFEATGRGVSPLPILPPATAGGLLGGLGDPQPRRRYP